MTRRIFACALLLLGLFAAVAEARAQDVVVVVSARSGVPALSAAEVADIFLGKTNRLPDGGQPVPVDLPEDSPLRDRFYLHYTGKSPPQVRAHWSKMIFTGRGQPPAQLASAAEIKRFVAANPQAIGYLDAALVDSSLRVVARP